MLKVKRETDFRITLLKLWFLKLHKLFSRKQTSNVPVCAAQILQFVWPVFLHFGSSLNYPLVNIDKTFEHQPVVRP